MVRSKQPSHPSVALADAPATTTSDAICSGPLRQGAPIALKGTKVALGHLHAAVIVLDDGTRDDLGLVSIEREHVDALAALPASS